MKSIFLQNLAIIVIIFFGFAAVFVLSDFLEKNHPQLPANLADEDLVLQGAKLKGFAFGSEGLIADWYWIKSLQYLGNKLVASKEEINLDNLKSLNPRLLYPYLDNATSLDPQFIAVYSYGATVLPAIDADQAIKIAEKGIANNPEEWRLYHYLGFIHWRLGNYQKATEIYAQGAKIQDAPPFMQMMVGKMQTSAGSRETARSIYRQMYEQAQDSQTKESSLLRLLELDSLDERESIYRVLQIHKEKTGNCAKNWQEAGVELKKVKLPNKSSLRFAPNGSPIDPTDIPYLLDTEKCEAAVDYKSSKIPPKL